MRLRPSQYPAARFAGGRRLIELHTHLLGGAARTLSPPVTSLVTGGWLRMSEVQIDRAVWYRQWSDACTLRVTLERSLAQPARRGRAADPGDRRGAVSFVPATVERRGAAAGGRVLGVEVSLDPAMIAEACEERLGGAWTASRDVQDAKAFAIVEALARALRQPGEPLLTDTMTVALARHLGRRHGGATRRRDDAWLHPAALRRVVGRIHATPADPPGLAELAELAGLGISGFVRGFRGSVGITPAAFSRRVRIARAEALLAEDMPLAELAAMTGFSSASHLARVFREQLGRTPRNGRKSA